MTPQHLVRSLCNAIVLTSEVPDDDGALTDDQWAATVRKAIEGQLEEREALRTVFLARPRE